jgi:hypothetical protein
MGANSSTRLAAKRGKMPLSNSGEMWLAAEFMACIQTSSLLGKVIAAHSKVG